jgi:hypothetical protein
MTTLAEKAAEYLTQRATLVNEVYGGLGRDHISVDTKHYGFGKLSTVERGHAYRAVIHPDHLPALRDTYHTGKPSVFRDEQGMTWHVNKADHGLDLKGGSRNRYAHVGHDIGTYHLPLSHEHVKQIID